MIGADERSRRPVPQSHPGRTDRATRARADVIATIASVVLLCAIALPRIISTPPWIDEAYTVAATEHLSESARFSHYTMSGYYAILWLWGQLSTSIIWLRMFSLVCAIFTIVCLRRLAILIGGRRLGTLAVVILPLLAMFQWKATEARAYALETLTVSLCWLVVASGRLDGEHGRLWLLVLGVAGVFGEFLHGMFVLQFLPISVFLLIRGRRPVAIVRAGLLSVVPAATGWLLWTAGASEVGTFAPGGPSTWASYFFRSFFGHMTVIILACIVGVTLWFVATVRPVVRHGRRPPAATWIPLLWVIVPTIGLSALSLEVNRFNPRYLAPILPGLAILFAQVGVWLDRSIVRGVNPTVPASFRRGLTGRFGSIIVVGVLVVGSMATPPFVDSPWKEMVQRVASADPNGSCIIFAELSATHPSQIRTPFETAWRMYERDHDLAVISSARQLGSPRRFDPTLAIRDVALRASDCRTVWVLSDANYDGDPANRYLAIEPFSTQFKALPVWTTSNGYMLTELRRVLPSRS